MIAFEDRAAAETRALAARRGFPLADVACALTGQRARFSDYVHFTRAGAAIVADVAARVLRPGEDSLLAGNIANAHSGCADLPATATSRQRTPVRLDQLSQIK
jgi:hypothetical protein